MVLARTEAATILTDERLRLSLAVRDWILGEAREIGDPNIILEGVSLMLRDAGIPIDRATSAVELRHAERAAPHLGVWQLCPRVHLRARTRLRCERQTAACGSSPPQ